MSRLFGVMLAALWAMTSLAAAEAFSAGLVELTLTDPVEGGPMLALAAYPAAETGSGTRRGPFTIAAAQNAKPASGSFPLVVISHGTGGTLWSHHDSLTALARAGLVAAAIEHPRDNYRDDSGFATDLQTIGRPHHVIALINGILAHGLLAPLIDPKRIGMVGHSAGGYTALVTVGGRPNFALRNDYNRTNPNDPISRRAATVSRERRKPDLQMAHDSRVRAAVLMAPALGFLFDREALSDVDVPLRIYRAGSDEMVPEPWNVERVRDLLPKPPEYIVIEGTGHFVFLAPCTVALAARNPAICTDPAGVDRGAIHARLNAELVDFFRRTLGLQ